MNKNNNNKKVQQTGGWGSGFVNQFYAWDASPAELSRITLERIDCAPMFNPLRKGTVMPTGTSGIIPAGVYLAHLPPKYGDCTTVECFNRMQQEALPSPLQNSVTTVQTGGCGCMGSNLAETQLGGRGQGSAMAAQTAAQTSQAAQAALRH